MKKIYMTFLFSMIGVLIFISTQGLPKLQDKLQQEIQKEVEKEKAEKAEKEKLVLNDPLLLLKNKNLIPAFGEYSQAQLINLGNKSFEVKYTIDPQLNKYINNLLEKFHPDYSAVVVLDNNTGKIISATGFQKEGNKIVPSLAFSNTHPCASLFKIVTAATLLQDSPVNPDTMFSYRGRSTTLYRSQLRDGNGKRRHGKLQSFKKAFAISNNVIFGKAAMQYCDPKELNNMAYKFGFNQNLMDEIGLSRSMTEISNNTNTGATDNINLEKNGIFNSQLELASLASGFNTKTTISPIHAALLSSILANDGVLIYPTIISKVIDQENNNNIWEKTPTEIRVIESKIAKELKAMMELTVREGTARKSFRKLKPILNRELLIGGKSGSITGGTPYGKRNWFTAFATPKDPSLGKGISISVMNVGVDSMSVKSAYLARNIIEFYFKKNFSPKLKITNNIKTSQETSQDFKSSKNAI